MLHPDPKRAWAEVFLTAIDLPKVRLHAVAGTYEPAATTRDGKLYGRSGIVPIDQRERLLAAFNGGFKTQHGQHGMLVDGVTLVEPKPALCSVVGYASGALEIGTWQSLDSKSGPEIDFLRQTPGCLLERGVLNPLLRDEHVKNWGATLDGNTVIRRSAIGLNRERKILFVALTNDTTARALADAMQHAGAADVAQLDVNWSYPKFLLFPRASNGTRYAQTLFDGFVWTRDEYIGRPSPRDFFFVTRR